MYKLLALDMDGTLLKEDKTISKVTKKAIIAARKRGIKVVLATGRPLHGIKNYLEELDLLGEHDYAVTYNGAAIQKTLTGEMIAKKFMTLDDMKFLNKLRQKLGVDMHALTPEACITPRINKYSETESYWNEIPLYELDFDNLAPDTQVVKAILVEDPPILKEAAEKLPKELYDKYSIMLSAPFFLEFLDKTVNKGTGVKLLAEKLNIRQDEIICIGDAENDIHMIKFAGLGVAMGNAFDNVKNAADFITKTNEEDGVAHVIDKFILAS